MEYILNNNQMKQLDDFTINNLGVPSVVLMERAALSVVEEMEGNNLDLSNVLIICGSGNNGGDGFAIARLLLLKNIKLKVLFLGNIKDCTHETLQQINILEKYDVNIYDDLDDLDDFTTIIDSIFGVGLTRNVEGKYKNIIQSINNLNSKVLSVDIPSGISGDSGEVMGEAIKADITVTFAYKKIGLLLYPGAEYAGKVILKDIGIKNTRDVLNLPIISYDISDLEKLPTRCSCSNKSTFGNVLVIAGSKNMAGAAYLSAKSAYKSGAGIVRIFTPEENRIILQTLIPEAILTTYEDKEEINSNIIEDIIQWADIIIIGPGMGISKTTLIILNNIINKTTLPIIIDADALNVISNNPEIIYDHQSQIIITPHLGEMSRLIGESIEHISSNLIDIATKFSIENNLICVLKDARTIVAKNKNNIYINQSGNNSMSTAGAGDVLTGIIASMIVQGKGLFEGACLGVYIHGLAGENASHKIGEYGVTAEDIIQNINCVLK